MKAFGCSRGKSSSTWIRKRIFLKKYLSLPFIACSPCVPNRPGIKRHQLHHFSFYRSHWKNLHEQSQVLGPPRLQRIPRRSYNCKKLQQKLIGFCHFILSSEALYAIAVYKIPKTGQKAKFHQILGNIVYECHFSFLFNRIEEASPESLLPQF